jgi:hypothetical protein
MRRKLRRNLKGISTIIATIIIVAISIVMAIAVAYWAMGIGNSFTKFEKVEYISIYADPRRSWAGNNPPIILPNNDIFNGSAFRVVLQLKNTGTAPATIDNIFIDTRPYTTFANVNVTNLVGYTLDIGSPRTGYIYLPTGGTWSPGNTVAITVSTAAGREYPNFVVLP